MRHLFRVFSQMFQISLRRSIAYRVDLLFDLLQATASFLTSLLGALAISQISYGGFGWNRSSLLCLTGTFAILAGLRGAFIEPSLVSFVDSIRDGRLDVALLEPIPDWFAASFRSHAVLSLGQSVLGVLLVGLAGFEGQDFSILGVMYWLILIIAGCAAMWAISLILSCLGFFAALFDLAPLTYALWDFGRYPGDAYSSGLRQLVLFVIPVCGIVQWPTMVLMGVSTVPVMTTGIISSIGLVILARIVLALGLRNYTGATS